MHPDHPDEKLEYTGVRGSVVYKFSAEPKLSYPHQLKQQCTAKQVVISKFKKRKVGSNSILELKKATMGNSFLTTNLEPDVDGFQNTGEDFVLDGDPDDADAGDSDYVYSDELHMKEDLPEERFFQNMQDALDYEPEPETEDSSDEEDMPFDFQEPEDDQMDGHKREKGEDMQADIDKHKRKSSKAKVAGKVKQPEGWDLPPPEWKEIKRKHKRQPKNNYWKPRMAEGEQTPREDPEFPNQPKGYKFFTKLEVFLMFFPLWIFDQIARETNRRFAQKPPSSETYKRRWLPTTREMWVRFLGILVLFCLSKQSRAELYWSKSSLCKVNPFETSGISYHRFRLMKRYMHCQDVDHISCQAKRGEPGHDPLALIRPVYDCFRVQCQFHIKPGRNLAIDERIIACKLLCVLRQKVAGKPTPNGIKVHVLATNGGLVIDIIIDDGMAYSRRKWALCGEAIILEFIDRNKLPPLTRLFFDRWYMSVRVSRFVAKPPLRVQTSGPINHRRMDFPHSTKKKPVPINVNISKKAQRGASKMLVTDEALVCAIGWRDSIQYYHVCAGFRLTGNTVVRNSYKKKELKDRIKKKKEAYVDLDTPIPSPPGVADYNEHMNKVLLLSPYHIFHRTRAPSSSSSCLFFHCPYHHAITPCILYATTSIG